LVEDVIFNTYYQDIRNLLPEKFNGCILKICREQPRYTEDSCGKAKTLRPRRKWFSSEEAQCEPTESVGVSGAADTHRIEKSSELN
jgi:hypothetical protein